MGSSVLLFATVICISLFLRLLLSQFFSQKFSREDSSMPMVPGIIAPFPMDNPGHRKTSYLEDKDHEH